MSDLFVCLTFDHDNASSSISRNMLTPTAISRGDFGIPATDRILKLLDAEKIPTTWFIPGHTIESYPSCVKRVFGAGHEIGNHGWTHRVPASLGREGEEEELVRGNQAIVTLTGKKMEVPVRKLLMGQPLEKVASKDATRNPAALDWFAAFAKARA